MSAEDNKALVGKLYDGFSRGDLEGVMALIADDAVDHALPPGIPPTKDGIRQAIGAWLGAFSDLRITPELLVSEGDLVAVHSRVTGRMTGEMMGLSPTGKSMEITTTEIFRVQDGRLAERWATEDNLGMFTQLGLQPPA